MADQMRRASSGSSRVEPVREHQVVWFLGVGSWQHLHLSGKRRIVRQQCGDFPCSSIATSMRPRSSFCSIVDGCRRAVIDGDAGVFEIIDDRVAERCASRIGEAFEGLAVPVGWRCPDA